MRSLVDSGRSFEGSTVDTLRAFEGMGRDMRRDTYRELQHRETDSNRLDSWKEIASFLRRDARTVRRWERDRGLPVHRVPGGERSGVFAYVSELEGWLHTADTAGASADRVASVELPGSTTSKAAADVALDLEAAALDHSDDQNTQIDGTVTSSTDNGLGRLRAERHPYQVGLLLLFLVASVGASFYVVHARERASVVFVHRPNPEAQELYLRGRYYWNLRTEDGLNRAVDLFTQSIVNDPDYAHAYAGLADSYLLLRQYGHMSNAEAYPRALAAAERAIALDDSCPGAHRSLAFILRFWNWDMPEAEREYRRAIALGPNDSQSHHWYATALLSSGRPEEALTEIDIARSLEPQSVSVLADRGLILTTVDPERGIAALEQVEQAQPEFVSTHIYLSTAYLDQGDLAKFLTESRVVAELRHDAATVAQVDRAREVLERRGAHPMLRELAESFADFARNGSAQAYPTARLFALAGEPQQAMRYLRLACDRREPGLLGFERDAAFNAIRSSAEYGTLIARRDAASGGRKEPIARLDLPVRP